MKYVLASGGIQPVIASPAMEMIVAGTAIHHVVAGMSVAQGHRLIAGMSAVQPYRPIAVPAIARANSRLQSLRRMGGLALRHQVPRAACRASSTDVCAVVAMVR